MKDLFGTELSSYDADGINGIQSALGYELALYRLYIVWNIVFMLAGCIYVYLNFHLYTTNEMLGILAMFWGTSGLPFFLLRDQVKSKYAAVLPDPELKPGLNPGLTVVKLVAGFFFGSWATHVMLIASFAKYFELKGYGKRLAEAAS